jgi:hypothetical protein
MHDCRLSATLIGQAHVVITPMIVIGPPALRDEAARPSCPRLPEIAATTRIRVMKPGGVVLLL